MKQIEQITTWNKIADNNTFNYHLANSMLLEELSETTLAMKRKDYTEMLDGILDLFIGFLHKKIYNNNSLVLNGLHILKTS